MTNTGPVSFLLLVASSSDALVTSSFCPNNLRPGDGFVFLRQERCTVPCLKQTSDAEPNSKCLGLCLH